MKWFVNLSNKKIGPVSSSDLLKMANVGQINANTPVRPAGGKSWYKAKQIRELKPIFSDNDETIATTASIPDRKSTPPEKLQPASSEHIFYIDGLVQVTSTRFIVGDTTYALRNITSVKSARAISPEVQLGATSFVVGAVLLLVGFIGCLLSTSVRVGVSGFGICLIVVGVACLFLSKPTFDVVITSTSGETHALTNRTQHYTENIVAAINNAIAAFP